MAVAVRMGMRFATIVATLAAITGCHTTMRTRTSPGRISLVEEGSCDSAMVRADEACVEHSVPDHQRTALAVLGAVGLIAGTIVLVNYADNHCPFC